MGAALGVGDNILKGLGDNILKGLGDNILKGLGDNILKGLGEIDSNTSMHIASYVIGLPLSLAIMWFVLLRPGMLAKLNIRLPVYVPQLQLSLNKN